MRKYTRHLLSLDECAARDPTFPRAARAGQGHRRGTKLHLPTAPGHARRAHRRTRCRWARQAGPARPNPLYAGSDGGRAFGSAAHWRGVDSWGEGEWGISRPTWPRPLFSSSHSLAQVQPEVSYRPVCGRAQVAQPRVDDVPISPVGLWVNCQQPVDSSYDWQPFANGRTGPEKVTEIHWRSPQTDRGQRFRARSPTAVDCTLFLGISGNFGRDATARSKAQRPSW